MIGPGPSESSSDSYNRIPYPSYPYSQTHPDHLATLGILTGISPEPVNNCRILELGCSSGGNLIPLAYSLPGSECLGIDFSERAIKKAKDSISKLSLKNCTFLEIDFTRLDRSFGQFDYIIAHGIFSWVSKEIQEVLLSACQELLSPNGIAYFSYNVYPGWHLYRVVRDFMFFHTRGSSDNEERIKSARSIIQYLSTTMPLWQPLLGQIFSHVQEQIKNSQDGYVRHDFLEEVNEPIYFTEFVERANFHNLQFMVNANLNTPAHVPGDVASTVLEGVEDDIEIEQYMDFLRNQFFRQTLLCRQELAIDRTIDPSRLTTLLFSSQMTAPSAHLDLISTEVMEFEGAGDLSVGTAHPLTKAALIHLINVYPKAVPYKNLVDSAWEMLAQADAFNVDNEQRSKDNNILKHNFIRFYSQSLDLMRFHTFSPGFVTGISDKPQASAVARLQAQNRQPITNLYHQNVTMDQFPRDLMGYLDGRRRHQELLDILVESAGQGLLEVAVEGMPVEEPALLQQHLAPVLESQLKEMARAALLVA